MTAVCDAITMLITKSLATPVIWALVLLALGLALSLARRRRGRSRAGGWLVFAGTLVLLVFSLNPVADLLAYSLESRYSLPSAEVLRSLDILVVLGGGMYRSGGLRTEPDLREPTYSRAYNGIRIFKESGASLLALTGGGSRTRPESEAAMMKAMAIRMGVPEDRIVTETRSRDTMQNAAFLAELLPKGTGRRIGLVTCATHMLRAQRVFRRQFPDDVIVPAPVHYTCSPRIWAPDNFIPSVYALEKSTVALHEWIGLLWYALRYR
jgi:uncharacterized SAM-binding protein YcdF (DUF218 family)